MNWYYAEGQQQRGPVSEQELADLVQGGVVKADTLIWREGMANWQPYGQVKPAAVAGAAPPPVGIPVPEDAVVCSQCGKMFGRDEAVRFGDAWVCAACKPIYLQRLKEGVAVPSTLEYAGFWIRFAAKLLDGLILGVVVALPFMVLAFVIGFRAAQGNIGANASGDAVFGATNPPLFMNFIGLFAQLVFIGVHVVYSTFFLGKYGATPGKMVCRIKVVDAYGAKITYGRAFGRSCAEILSRVICGIGYIIAAFDGQKRALHDHICNTRVVQNR